MLLGTKKMSMPALQHPGSSTTCSLSSSYTGAIATEENVIRGTERFKYLRLTRDEALKTYRTRTEKAANKRRSKANKKDRKECKKDRQERHSRKARKKDMTEKHARKTPKKDKQERHARKASKKGTQERNARES